MTRPDLDAIEQRGKRATDGPWKSVNLSKNPAVSDPAVRALVGHWRDVPYTVAYCGYGGSIQAHDNADFIAAAREDVPALVAYARTLEQAHIEIVRREAQSQYQSIYSAPGEFAAISREAIGESLNYLLTQARRRN